MFSRSLPSAFRWRRWRLFAAAWAVALNLACVPRLRPSSDELAGTSPALLRECRLVASRLRSLEFRHRVDARVQAPAALEASVGHTLDQELPPDRLEQRRLELSAFGFIPPDFDLKGFLEALYAEQLGGYYDPATGALVLVGKRPSSPDADGGEGEGPDARSATGAGGAGETGPGSETTGAWTAALRRRGITPEKLFLVHELVHALQDQNLVPLRELMAAGQGPEALLARRALVEGDATFVMTQYLAGEETDLTLRDDLAGPALEAVEAGLLPGTRVLATGPRYFREQLLFSYYHGMDFVIRLLREGGWKVVNAAYGAPPVSSEQILHPGRYVEGEMPHAVTISPWPALEALEYRPVAEGTLGELGLRVWLTDSLGRDVAAQAATGWGGDRYRVYLGPGGTAVFWAISLDTVAEAVELEAALETHSAAWPARLSILRWHREGDLVRLAWGDGPGLEPAWGQPPEVTMRRLPPVPPAFLEPARR